MTRRLHDRQSERQYGKNPTARRGEQFLFLNACHKARLDALESAIRDEENHARQYGCGRLRQSPDVVHG